MFVDALWCWIEASNRGLFEFACFYVLLLLVTIAVGFMWIRVLANIISIRDSAHRTHALPSYVYRHVVGVLLFDLIFILMAAHRIYVAFSEQQTSVVLLLGHEIGLCSVGILIGVCFGFTKDNFRLWRDVLCCNRKPPMYTSI
jgi:hypothetical protein